MRRGSLLAAGVAAALVAAAAGCGGSTGVADESALPAEGRFFQQGFGITFAYPRELEPADDLVFGTTAGPVDSARAAIGLDRDNVIVVSRYELRRPVTHANVGAVKAEVDGVISNLAGERHSGRPIEFGGLPGYEYSVGLSAPHEGRSLVVVLFDGKSEYFFNCQSTPDARLLVVAACRQALGTLQTLDAR